MNGRSMNNGVLYAHAAANDGDGLLGGEKEITIGEYRAADLKHRWTIVIQRDDYEPHEWCHLSAEEL